MGFVMKLLNQLFFRKQSLFVLLVLAVTFSSVVVASAESPQASSESAANAFPTARRINVPYTALPVDGVYHLPAISLSSNFWFGTINETTNFTDVRMIYNDTTLFVHVNVYDRWLWYNEEPGTEPLTNWDSASLYINTAGATGGSPSATTHQFVAQFGPDDWVRGRRDLYQYGFQGNGSDYVPSAAPFTTHSYYRGEGGPNSGLENRGWWVTYQIPFSSLGVSRPADGTQWGLAMVVNDKDTATGGTAMTFWPEALNGHAPATWGQLSFGEIQYQAPVVTNPQTVRIQNGVDGGVMVDAHVGGHTNCGDAEENPTFWTPENPNPGLPFPDIYNGWPNRNRAGFQQINVQNQVDVVDWPCYSRYYIQVPLNPVPAGKQIVSAKMTFYQFGNGGLGYNAAYGSFIRAYTLAQPWDENTITWNNAPMALENLNGTWVESLDPVTYPNYYANPPLPRTLDVSKAVADFYATGQPLNLAIWSADAPPHSGKYFYSVELDDPQYRPVLEIVYGDGQGSASPPPAAAPAQPAAPAAPAAPSAPVSAGLTYTIQPGDTLSVVARKTGFSLGQILNANPSLTNPNLIFVGQVINLPGSSASLPAPVAPAPATNAGEVVQPAPTAPPAAAPVAAPSSGGSTYVVQPGNTLSIIARRVGTSLRELLNLNPQLENPNVIYPGQTLNTP